MGIWPATNNPLLRAGVVTCFLVLAALAALLVRGSVVVFVTEGFKIFNGAMLLVSAALLYVAFSLWRLRPWARKVATILLPILGIGGAVLFTVGLPFDSTARAVGFVAAQILGVATAIGGPLVLSMNASPQPFGPARKIGWIILFILAALLTWVSVPNTMRLDETRLQTGKLCSFATPGMPYQRVEDKAREIGLGVNRHPGTHGAPTRLSTVPATFFFQWRCSVDFARGKVTGTEHRSFAM